MRPGGCSKVSEIGGMSEVQALEATGPRDVRLPAYEGAVAPSFDTMAMVDDESSAFAMMSIFSWSPTTT